MRTWGQIRFELAKAHPGLDLELLTGWMQAAYHELLDGREWPGLDAEGVLETTGVHRAGTVTLTLGSVTVTGAGTAFTAAMTGRRFRLRGIVASYGFTWVSATAGTLDRPWAGEDGTGLAYELFQDTYRLPEDLKTLTQVANPRVAGAMERWTPAAFLWLTAAGPAYGEPIRWGLAPDTDEETPPVRHQVRVYPAPERDGTLLLRYQRAPFGFDGTNTGSAPLPWVSTDAILAGVRARALAHEKDATGAAQARLECEQFLRRMHAVESEREGPRRLAMADRFTRHQRRRC